MLKNIRSVFLLNLGVYLKETGIPSLLVIKKKKTRIEYTLFKSMMKTENCNLDLFTSICRSVE